MTDDDARALALSRERAAADEVRLRKQSDDRHAAHDAHYAELREDIRRMGSSIELASTTATQLLDKYRTIAEQQEATLQKVDQLATDRADSERRTKETLDKWKGGLSAIIAAAGLFNALGFSVGGWMLSTTIETRQTSAVHESELRALHAEDDASKQERRELREAVTRAVGAVERVAATVEAVGERIDDIEDEQRAARARGR